MIKWQVNIKIWQVNIKIWQDDIKIWQVNRIIWQLMLEICHHKKALEEQSRSICGVILMQNCREICSLLHPRDTAEHRSKYRQRWCLYMSEKFSMGNKQTNKQTKFKRGNQSTQRGSSYGSFWIDYSNFILARDFREFEVIINDCTESGFQILFRYLSKVHTKSFGIIVYKIIEDTSKFSSIKINLHDSRIFSKCVLPLYSEKEFNKIKMHKCINN